MPDVLDCRDGVSPVLEEVAASLREGLLAALPTEAGYEAVACAWRADAAVTLSRLAPDERPAVLLAEENEALDWLPHLRSTGRRLIRRFWPGPLTIFSNSGATFGLARRLPAEVQRLLVHKQALPLRLPDHDWPGPLRRFLAGPLLTAPLPGFPQEVKQIANREAFGIILDGGLTPFVKPPTVVQIDDGGTTVLREGAVPRADIEFETPCHVLFLCTGNTCRSPLAEGLCRVLLSATLGCAPADLSRRGFVLQSAGLAAGAGNPATVEAVLAGERHGADLRGHCSQPLSLELLARADLVFTMTWAQLSLLHSFRGPAYAPLQLLCPDGHDINDPIGCSDDVYQVCAAQIRQALHQRLPEILES